MKDKKGFTLIELLVIIVILGALVVLATTSVTKILDNAKKDTLKQTAKTIISAALMKTSENSTNSSICYNLSDLSAYIEQDLSGYTGSILIDFENNTESIWLGSGDYKIVGENESNFIITKKLDDEEITTKCDPEGLIHILTIDPVGGTYSGEPIVEIQEGTTIILSNITKENYAFDGWLIDGEGSSFNETTNEFTMGSENTTITAQWIPIYRLTVNANGGIWNGISPLTMTSDESVNIEDPTRINYIFTGWKVIGEESSFNDITNTFTMGTEDATLEAKWELNAFALTVNSNGGIWDGTTPQTLVVGTSTIIEEPTKAGHVFNEWTVVGEGSSFNETTNEFTMGSENTTITANWLSYMEMFTYTIDGKSGASGTDYELILEENDWKIKFLTSGTFTPLADMEIDAFLVGGGGSGGSHNGGGGGGGYTKTEVGLDIAKNDGIQVIIGAGATGVSQVIIEAGGNEVPHPIDGNDGGATLFGNISVAGGIGGLGWSYPKTNAGSGGSGGGCFNISGAYGGSDGGNGFSSGSSAGGTGQGSTTREFGEADGTLYAGGGAGLSGSGGSGGGGAYGVSGTPNTGGGGGGSNIGVISGAGGSGIVVIRNSRNISP